MPSALLPTPEIHRVEGRLASDPDVLDVDVGGPTVDAGGDVADALCGADALAEVHDEGELGLAALGRDPRANRLILGLSVPLLVAAMATLPLRFP